MPARLPLPQLQGTFIHFGSLKVGCFIIFTFFLLLCGFWANKYLGMYWVTMAIYVKKGNISYHDIVQAEKEYVTMQPKGSAIIGSINAVYWVLSIFGIIGMIMNLPEFLIAPLVLLPMLAFTILMLIFFDLGIQETSGFLYVYVFTGFVAKVIIAAFTVYCFLVIYSYYVEQTEGPIIVIPTQPSQPPPPVTTPPPLILPP